MKKIFLLFLICFSLVYFSGCKINRNRNNIDYSQLSNKEEIQKTEIKKPDNLIFLCENKDCFLEKFKKCDISQFIIDNNIENKAYFVIFGLDNKKECSVLIEKDFQNGVKCNIPESIIRDEDLLNDLVNYKIDKVKDYCKAISAK